MARISWVAIERYDVFSSSELQRLLQNAHQITFAKLSKRTRDVLAMPATERKKLIAARKKLLRSPKKSQ
jgi:hypothetical protein